MQPRQQFPIHGHMGPNRMGPAPYGRNYPMTGPYGGGVPMMGRVQQFHGGSHMMSPMMGRTQGRNGGGLLAKILGGRKKQGNPAAGFGGMQAAGHTQTRGGGGIGSILQTLSKPEGLSGILNNTQQVLKTVEAFGPMIQQYGPIVKNLPVMWKLYKGFKDLPSAENAEEHTTEAPAVEETHVEEESIDQVESTQEEVVPHVRKAARRPKKNASSKPRLYI